MLASRVARSAAVRRRPALGELVAMGSGGLLHELVRAQQAQLAADLGGQASLLVDRGGRSFRVEQEPQLAGAEAGGGELAA